jgi:hypothetical protein
MKIYSWLLCLLALCPARAGELLKNGDFSEGKTHWFGDGVAPADLAPDNPLAAKNPGTADKMLIVPLNPHHWTKVTQEFRTHAAHYNVLLILSATPDLKFSDNKDDYEKADDEVGLWNYKIYLPGDNFLCGIIDSSKRFVMEGYNPAKNLSKNCRIIFNVDDTTSGDLKTLFFAFPPGTGNVILKSASITTPD